MRGFSVFMLCMSAAAIPGFAQDSQPDKPLDIRTTGYFIVEGGYVSETEDVSLKKWKNEPYGDFIGGLRLTASPSERMRLIINPEMKSHSIFPMSPGITLGENKQRLKYDVYLEEAKASWFWGEAEKPSYALDFGYMIYKVNPDGKIFGDYLFRSMIYPALPFTKFDYPQAQIAGLRLGMNHLDGALRNQFFLLTEVEHYPYYDLSAAWSGSFTFGKFLELGAGVNARSIVPIRPSRTQPTGGEGLGLQDNTYKFVPFQAGTGIKDSTGAVFKTISIVAVGTDSADVTVQLADGSPPEIIRVPSVPGGIAGLSRGPLNNKAIGNLTPTDGVGDLYPELRGTNTHYTFAGQIITGRINFNPMAFAPDPDALGKDALKLYVEAAVLGWSNYPGYYEKRAERMPIMFGFNFPTFGFLDNATLEVEQFASKELPTYDKRSFQNIPQPGNHKEEIETLWDDERRKKDDLKWVFQARKSFQGWSLVGQFGTDHMKLADESETATLDVMSRPSQWYVQLRFVGGIR